MRYSVIESKSNQGNFHVRVTEDIIHPTLGFPVGSKTGFAQAMSQEHAELAKTACETGEFGYRLIGEPNEKGLYNVEPVI